MRYDHLLNISSISMRRSSSGPFPPFRERHHLSGPNVRPLFAEKSRNQFIWILTTVQSIWMRNKTDFNTHKKVFISQSDYDIERNARRLDPLFSSVFCLWSSNFVRQITGWLDVGQALKWSPIHWMRSRFSDKCSQT